MKWIRNALLRHLLKAVTENDLQNAWDKLPDHKKKQYKAEAQAMTKYELYGWVKSVMETKAGERMTYNAKNEMDIIFGKAMLHSESVRNKLIHNIKNS